MNLEQIFPVWQREMDTQAFCLQPRQSLRWHSCLKVGGEGRHQEKTSPSGAALALFMRLWSWYPSLGTFVELNLSRFLWLGYNLNIPGYQALFSSRPCGFPAHPNSRPCWASKEQGSQGGAGGGWGSCLPPSHKQGSEGSFCMPRMPSVECCES